MPSNTKITYKGLEKGELLAIARDALRAVESEHFRLSLATATREPEQHEQDRLDQLAAQIEGIQAEVASLSKE